MKTKIINFFQNLLFIISILICVFILAQKTFFKENGVFGYRTYVIITSSMKPHLEIGDVIMVKKVPSKEIKEGDIVTYQGKESDFKGKIVTHLVKNVTIDEDGKYIFYTKGMLTNMIDPAVYEDQIYGKLVYRMYLISLVSKLIRSKWGFVVLILIPLIIILIKQLLTIKKEIKGENKEDNNNKNLIKEYKLKKKKEKYEMKKIATSLKKSFKKKKSREILFIKDPSEELEKTLYSSDFRKEIDRELNKTIVSSDLRKEIDKKLKEEKISKPKKGLESTIYGTELLDEIKKEQNKVPEIVVIDD